MFNFLNFEFDFLVQGDLAQLFNVYSQVLDLHLKFLIVL